MACVPVVKLRSVKQSAVRIPGFSGPAPVRHLTLPALGAWIAEPGGANR